MILRLFSIYFLYIQNNMLYNQIIDFKLIIIQKSKITQALMITHSYMWI